VASKLPVQLHDAIDRQGGVLARSQLLAAGLTAKMIEVRLRSGAWQRLQTGVYATFSGEPPRGALLWAAVLRAGPAAALSHHSAAELYGLLDTPAHAIHVTVARGSQVARPRGSVIHYSGRLERARHPVLTPPRTRVEETVLDIAATAATLDQAISVVLRASASRLTTAAHIAATMQTHSRMRWRRELTAALGLAGQGVQSLLEFRYVNWVERPHGLPPGRRQQPVQRGRRREYRDVEYEEYGLVVELDGRGAHPEWRRWADIRRDNAAAAAGRATLRYGWADVSDEACRIAQEVGDVLRQRGWGGPLRRCRRSCPVSG
jgi:hypothetical protein